MLSTGQASSVWPANCSLKSNMTPWSWMSHVWEDTHTAEISIKDRRETGDGSSLWHHLWAGLSATPKARHSHHCYCHSRGCETLLEMLMYIPLPSPITPHTEQVNPTLPRVAWCMLYELAASSYIGSPRMASSKIQVAQSTWERVYVWTQLHRWTSMTKRISNTSL